MDKLKASPSVSVVMPVRNALPFLDESIESILNQTFEDFEFVILDDVSTDGTTTRLREWARRDERIRLYEAREKRPPSGHSNFVVQRARAPLIARMDADDISHPDRLMRQREVMKSRPDVAMVGTLFEGIDKKGRRVRRRDRWRLARKSSFPPFPHGSVMFRREIFDSVGGYFSECDSWEDHDLFLRIRRRARVVVLTDVLYYYRFHVNNVTSNRVMDRTIEAYSVRQRCLNELRQGHDYTPLLKEAESNGYHKEALAYMLYLRGATRLWAGHQPEILDLALRQKSFGSGWHGLGNLILATWGELSPKTLRLSLRMLIGARDLLASYRVKDGGVYEWHLE